MQQQISIFDGGPRLRFPPPLLNPSLSQSKVHMNVQKEEKKHDSKNGCNLLGYNSAVTPATDNKKLLAFSHIGCKNWSQLVI